MKLFVLLLALAICVVPLQASIGLPTWRAGNHLLEREDAVEIQDDADPTEMQSCYSMGQIKLTYESGMWESRTWDCALPIHEAGKSDTIP